MLADYGSFQLVEFPEGAPPPSHPRVEVVDDFDFIELNAARLDTRSPTAMALRRNATTSAERQLHLVQFVGPVLPAWRTALEASGVRVIHYVPQNAYLIHGTGPALTQMQAWAATADFVQWEGAYTSDLKIHPHAHPTDTKGRPVTRAGDLFAVQLVADAEANPATLNLIAQLQFAPIQQQFQILDYLNVIVRLPATSLAEIAARPDVVSIQPYLPRRKFDERQDQIVAGNLSGNLPSGPGYLTWLTNKGFTQAQFAASGFIVDVTDSGIDNGTVTPGHFGLYQDGNKTSSSRVAYNRLVGTANPGSTLAGCDGHGTLNAHIIAGYDNASGFPFADSSGYHYGLGVCPFVSVGSSVIFDATNFTTPNYADLQSRAYSSGARVSANSWGGGADGVYDVDAQTYDALVRDAQPAGATNAATGNQPMIIVFAAGNDGPTATTIGSPGTAKNVICVGAGEGVQAFSGTDGSNVSDNGANSANDIISFSSRGPCADGRRKPDLCAPGTHISGGVPQVNSPSATGTAISCFNGEGVSGGVYPSLYWPSGQQFYTASSGTSHSTPAIAGCCALVRQYFINQSLPVPSPAMTKAYLMNSARYMNGTMAGDTLPSNAQGMGEANLGMAFDGAGRVLRDQLAADKFTASGQVRTFTGTVSDVSKPFRVTLAWTDAPGNTFGNSYNNDLDLVVTINGNTYRGNFFTTSASATGGAADARNNVESVFLPAGITGSFVVTVTAASINSDGVPNEAPTLDQDFALVIYNATPAAVPAIAPETAAVLTEGCAAPNGAADPGELVSVNFALRNFGSADASNVLATLLPTGGVATPSAPQTYGSLVAGGGAVTQAFSFLAQGPCGGAVIATLALTNNGTNLGFAAFTLPLGSTVTVFAEDFDAVAPPALPVGWTSSQTGGQQIWTTSSARADSSPSAAVSGEATTTGINELVSPSITLPTGASQLSFRQRVNLESEGLTAYDAGLLEIKIANGSWADILTAGGAFVTGAYTHTNDSGNALPARKSWSGVSAGFVQTVVNLPAAAAGQNIQLRWRCSTDVGTGGGDWMIDSIKITTPSCCGNLVAPLVNVQPTNRVVFVGENPSFVVGATGSLPLAYQWRLAGTNLPGATQSALTVNGAQPKDAGAYSVVVSNVAGIASSSTATLTVLSSMTGVLAGWNVSALSGFGPSPFAATTNSPLVSVAGLTRGPGVATNVTAATAAWGGNDFASNSLAAAITGGDFVTFSIGAQAGYKVSFSAINKFDYRRSTTTGPTQGVMQYQVGSGAFISFATNTYVSGTSGNSLAAIDLGGIASLQNVGAGTNVTFRIVIFNGGSGGTWYVYDKAGTAASDLEISGAVSATLIASPAPPALALTGLSGNQFQFSLTGTTGANYVVEVSTNLAAGSWLPVRTSTPPLLFTEPATNGQRFFRGRIAP